MRRRWATAKAWVCSWNRALLAVVESAVVRSSFDQKLDMLLPLLADREEFKDAVLMFAQVGLTAEEIEKLAIETVRERCGLPALHSEDPEQHRFGRA